MCNTQNRFNALLSACVLSLIATAGWSQSLTWLGTLPDGYGSQAYGVSADGAVVVGWADNGAGYGRAFRWQNGVMQNLGTLAGDLSYASSYAFGVSADGAVVVGEAEGEAEYGVGDGRAFRWTASGGMQDLDTLGGGGSMASGVSADGAVVVGVVYRRAFRWTALGGMQDLGTLGGYWSGAYGVSADGAVVVGGARNAAGQPRAFRWTASGGMQDLGTLPGSRESGAYSVSADGSVVVGWDYNAGQGQYRAFRWTAAGGMEDLNTTYASLLTNGSVLIKARAISPDGRYIVGWGINAATERLEAFLLDTRCTAHNGDVDANGCVDDADLLAVLFAFGNTGSNLVRVDVNCDGVVDDADLLQVLFNFGSGC